MKEKTVVFVAAPVNEPVNERRQDARAVAKAIVNHAEAIEGYAMDPAVTDEVFEHEVLGRAHLIAARLGRLREAAAQQSTEAA